MERSTIGKISLCIGLGIFICLIVEGISTSNEYKHSCRDAGYEKYIGGSPEYCLDKDGNYYPIIMECNFWGFNCTARDIKIMNGN